MREVDLKRKERREADNEKVAREGLGRQMRVWKVDWFSGMGRETGKIIKS